MVKKIEDVVTDMGLPGEKQVVRLHVEEGDMVACPDGTISLDEVEPGDLVVGLAKGDEGFTFIGGRRGPDTPQSRKEMVYWIMLGMLEHDIWSYDSIAIGRVESHGGDDATLRDIQTYEVRDIKDFPSA